MWFCICMLCFFIWGYMQVFAAADQDYFPMEQNHNNLFTEAQLQKMETDLDSENNYIFTYIYLYDNNGWTKCYYISYPKTMNDGVPCLYLEKNNNLYQFSAYVLFNSYVTVGEWRIERSTLQSTNRIIGQNQLSYFQNLQSNMYNSSIDCVSNYQIYNNNTETKKIMLVYQSGDQEELPDNDTYPLEAEKPNISDYFDPDDAPLFDNTDVPSAIESLYNILKWFFGQGLPGLINYLIDNTNWAIQKIINNIRELIEDFVETVDGHLSDIKDWIDDIKDGLDTLVDFVINPWDSSEFQTDLNASTFYTSLNGTVTNIRNFGTSLTRANEPEDLSFTINLTSIGWGTSEIDFNWIKPFRNIIRLIIGCVLVYWLVITVITSINNIVSSGSDNEE